MELVSVTDECDLLAGATVEIPAIGELAYLCIAYVILRFVGRLLGGLIGARLLGRSDRDGVWTGAALTPQAGVALGMALVAAGYLPEQRETIVSVTVVTTVVFEVAGPFITLLALKRNGGAE